MVQSKPSQLASEPDLDLNPRMSAAPILLDVPHRLCQENMTYLSSPSVLFWNIGLSKSTGVEEDSASLVRTWFEDSACLVQRLSWRPQDVLPSSDPRLLLSVSAYQASHIDIQSQI